MNTPERAEKQVAQAFSKLLKTSSEIVEDLANEGLITTVKSDISCGTFKVEVTKTIPPTFAEEIQAIKTEIQIIKEEQAKAETPELPKEEKPPKKEEEETTETETVEDPENKTKTVEGDQNEED